MIFIIGNSFDKVKSVTEYLVSNSNKEVVFYEASKCLEDHFISYSYQNGKLKILLGVSGKRIDVDEIHSFWYWKPILPKELRFFKKTDHQKFIDRQFLSLWSSLSRVLGYKQTINNFFDMVVAERKPVQLKIAQEIGFVIPNTLITSNPNEARVFKNENSSIVIKSLMTTAMNGSVIYTSKVSDELIAQFDRLKSCPVILQEQIFTSKEYRVTVVGDKIFTAEVSSDSYLDWRRSTVRCTRVKLPKELEKKCIILCERLNLKYATIDIIEDMNNKYYFLELNPNGHYGFVEEQTGFLIGESIARLLI